MRYFILVAAVLWNSTVIADDKDEIRRAFEIRKAFDKPTQDDSEIRTAFEFQQMKASSNYAQDVARTTGMVIVWVDHEDLALFKWLKANKPDAIHTWTKASNLTGAFKPGYIVGVRRGSNVEQVKVINSSMVGGLKTEEVILTFTTLDQSCPDGRCPIRR